MNWVDIKKEKPPYGVEVLGLLKARGYHRGKCFAVVVVLEESLRGAPDDHTEWYLGEAVSGHDADLYPGEIIYWMRLPSFPEKIIKP